MTLKQLSPGWRCHACLVRGWPDEYATEPTCAFREDGSFSGLNWSCATMLNARYSKATLQSRHDDNSVFLVPIDDGWAILRCYKERGMTSFATVLTFDNDIRPLHYHDLCDRFAKESR